MTFHPAAGSALQLLQTDSLQQQGARRCHVHAGTQCIVWCSLQTMRLNNTGQCCREALSHICSGMTNMLSCVSIRRSRLCFVTTSSWQLQHKSADTCSVSVTGGRQTPPAQDVAFVMLRCIAMALAMEGHHV